MMCMANDFTNVNRSSNATMMSACVFASLLLHGLFFYYWALHDEVAKALMPMGMSAPFTHSQKVSVVISQRTTLPASEDRAKSPAAISPPPHKNNHPLHQKTIKSTIKKNVPDKKVLTSISPKSLTNKQNTVPRREVVQAPSAGAVSTTSLSTKEEKNRKNKSEKLRGDSVSQEKPQASVPESLDTLPVTSAPANSQVLNEQQLRLYEQHLIEWINRYKRYPLAAQKRQQQGVVTAVFTIDGGGHLKSYKIASTSGYKLLDKAVIKMLKRANPMPEVPMEIRKGKSSFSYAVPIVFSL